MKVTTKSKLKKIGASIAILGSIGVAPIVPKPMMLATSFCDVASHFVDKPTSTTVSSTSTPKDASVQFNDHPSSFRDDDGNGYICASIFIQSDGTPLVVQISDAVYESMGLVNGTKNNPTKTEFLSPVEILTPTASAAIARDATSTSGVTIATSQTWAHTMSAGSNGVLFLYGFVRSTDATNLSTAKYNGVLMSTTTPAWSDYLEGKYGWMMHLAAPTSGTNNIVTTFNASLSTTWAAVSYTGASQSGIPDSIVTNAGDATSNNFSMSTTVVASNSWLLMSQIGVDAGSCSTATSPAVLINTQNPGQTDTNGVVGTGSQSIAVTGCGNRIQVKVILSFAPAANVVNATVPQPLLIFSDE
jgi:hypothetical protein